MAPQNAAGVAEAPPEPKAETPPKRKPGRPRKVPFAQPGGAPPPTKPPVSPEEAQARAEAARKRAEERARKAKMAEIPEVTPGEVYALVTEPLWGAVVPTVVTFFGADWEAPPEKRLQVWNGALTGVLNKYRWWLFTHMGEIMLAATTLTMVAGGVKARAKKPRLVDPAPDSPEPTPEAPPSNHREGGTE